MAGSTTAMICQLLARSIFAFGIYLTAQILDYLEWQTPSIFALWWNSSSPKGFLIKFISCCFILINFLCSTIWLPCLTARFRTNADEGAVEKLSVTEHCAAMLEGPYKQCPHLEGGGWLSDSCFLQLPTCEVEMPSSSPSCSLLAFRQVCCDPSV